MMRSGCKIAKKFSYCRHFIYHFNHKPMEITGLALKKAANVASGKGEGKRLRSLV